MKPAAIPLLLSLAAALCAQPAFDAASVKGVSAPQTSLNPDAPPAPPPPPGLKLSPKGLTIENATLRYCLTWAYGVRNWQVTGPGWIDRNLYGIAARTENPVETAQLKIMLQSLLAERFHLKLRRETRETRVLALVVPPGGSKLVPSAAGTPSKRQFDPLSNAGIRVVATNSPLDLAVQLLTLPLWDPVVDRTGLTGTYDFTFERPPRDPENPDGWLGDIGAALQRNMGLKLEPRKEPVEIIAVEQGNPIPDEI